VSAKPPFTGPEAVLAYLARYTHRVAIANNRLVALDERGVTFRYKDYRRNGEGAASHDDPQRQRESEPMSTSRTEPRITICGIPELGEHSAAG
jgi:hypothetical protein